MLRGGIGNVRPLLGGANEVKLPPDSRLEEDVGGPENCAGKAGVSGDLQ